MLVSRIALIVLLASSTWSGERAFAADHPAEHATEHPMAHAAAEPVATALPASSASASEDPMDRLRDRLAEKLGGAKVTAADNRSTLRVTSNIASPAGSAGGHDAGTVSARRAARRAAGAPDTAQAANAAHPPAWDYSGGPNGPQRWAQMNPEFAKCGNGTRQSPIDLRDGIKVDLEPVRFDYKPSAFRVIDNGHTVQVNLAAGNTIEVMGRRYELQQFHFHRPSEERIDGRQFDMVMHLVHQDTEGRIAIVAVLLERGSAQTIIQQVWANLPLEKNEEVAARGAIDPNEMLPAARAYFTYMGSLTEPPCSEGVLWMVMKEPVQISTEQVAVFTHLYPMNARPVQPASGRLIKQSN